MIPYHDLTGSAQSAWGSAPRSYKDHKTRLLNAKERNILLQDTPKGIRIGSMGKDYTLSGTAQNALFHKYQVNVVASRGGHAVLKELLSQPVFMLRKIQRIWEPTERKLELAFPNWTREVMIYTIKWWKILVRCVIDTGISGAVKFYKKFSRSLLSHFGGLVQSGDNNLVESKDWEQSPYPKIPEGTWMESSPPLTRAETICCKIIAETRDLPPADSHQISKKLEEHRQTTVYDVPEKVSRGEKARIKKYAKIAAAEVWVCVGNTNLKNRKTGRISISAASCYEYSRTQGGKRSFIVKALLEFANAPWSEDEIELCSRRTDGSYELTSPMGTSVIIDYPFQFRNIAFGGDIDFGKPNPDDPTGNPIGFTEEIISKMTFFMSWIYLVKRGYLEPDGTHTGKPYDTKVSGIGEPGNKARIVTRAEALLVTYMQPMAHIMKQILMEDPSLRTGFQPGNQLWELAKRLDKHVQDTRLESFQRKTWLYGDYDTATDRFVRERAELAMRELFPRGEHNNYIDGTLDIILGSWCREGELTVRGIPMGMPCTKPILHFVGKCIEVDSKGITFPRTKGQLYREPFGVAGDDIINVDDLETNLRFIDRVPIYGLFPSLEKWGIYRYFGKYCESLCITHDGGGFGFPTSYKDTVFVDTPKMRLASSETKFTKGDNDRIPFWGKARMTTKQRGFLKNESDYEPYEGMWQLHQYGLLQSSVRHIGTEGAMHWMNFIPLPLGGNGFQINDFETFYQEHVPQWFTNAALYLIEEVKKCTNPETSGDFDLNTFQVVKRSLGAFGTNTILRRGLKEGEIRPELQMFMELKEVLDDNLVDLRSEEDAYSEHLQNNPNEIVEDRFYAKRRVLNENGWLNLLEESALRQMTNVWDSSNPRQKRGFKRIAHSKREKKLQARINELALEYVDLTEDKIQAIMSVTDKDLRYKFKTWVKEEELETLGHPVISKKALAHSVSLNVKNSDLLSLA